jgi:FkbM family methyltransferase
MGSYKSFDVRIAVFVRKILNFYIKKRATEKIIPLEDKIWESLFKTTNKIIYQIGENVKINLFKESQLCKLIYFGFEQTEMSFIKAFLKEGDIFIDIGSNIGMFSLTASDLVGSKGKILAFEPTPSTYERLLENIRINGYTNINAFNLGLSNKNGILDFNISNNGYDAWNSMVQQEHLENGIQIQVEVKALDSLIEENSLSTINLIKIDVEGWEKFVLEGSINLLNRSDSPVILVEFTETTAFNAGYYLGELFDFMKTFGYNWYSYDVENNKLNPEIKKLHYPWENLIAVKNYNETVSRIQSKS